MSEGNPGSKAFINPDRMRALNLHNLAGSAPPSAPSQYNHPQAGGYGRPDDRGAPPPPRYDGGGYGRPDTRDAPRDYRQSSYGAPPPSQGYGSRDFPPRDRYGAGPPPRGDRRGNRRDRGGYRGGREAIKRDFGYDDSVRPRPKKPSKNWDREATTDEMRYRMNYLTQHAVAPGISRSIPKNVTGMSFEALSSAGGAPMTSAAALGLLPSAIAGERAAMVMPMEPHTATLNDRQANRVYFGGINNHVDEGHLRDFVFRTLITIPERPRPAVPTPTPMDMIRGVQMNESYAFLEFTNHSDAELAFSMDGITYEGLVLKVKPPKEMKSYYDQNPVRRVVIPGALSSSVENGPNKIFIGNLPRELPDDDIRRLCETIGPLSAFNIVKNANDGSSKGYGFLTYRDPANTHTALQFLNNQEYSGKVLSCSIAQDPVGFPSSGMQMPVPVVSHIPAKRAIAAHLAPISEGGTTRILVLHNMCTAEELRTEYDDIITDVRDECSVHGHIEEIVGLVDLVYVAFANIEGAAKSATLLTGRKFGENYVGTSSMSEQTFYDTISRQRR